MKISLSNSPPQRRPHSAFSLVEIVIAMAIIATGMIAIIGLIPVGLQASRDAAVRSTTAIIIEDVHDRLKGHILDQDEVGDASQRLAVNPFYYDDQGIYLPIPDEGDINEILAAGSSAAQRSVEALKFRRRFRVDVRVEDILDANQPDGIQIRLGNAFGEDPLRTERVKAAIISLSWPVSPSDGTLSPRATSQPRAHSQRA